MGLTIDFKKRQVFFAVGLAWLLLIVLTQSSAILRHNKLADAIAIDLLFLIPVVYFLAIRKTAIPNTTTIPIVIMGLILGGYFLPESQQSYLDWFKVLVLPILEIVILSYVLFKTVRKVIFLNKQNNIHIDFYDNIKIICQEQFPRKLAHIIANEIAIIYYGFVTWRRPVLQINEFSYHKSGIYGLAGVFIFSIVLETFVFHLFLGLMSSILAWVFTALSIYTLVQVFGIIKSLPRRPIKVTSDKLILRYGILAQTEIELIDITNIQVINLITISEEATSLSPFALFEGQNIVLSVKHPYVLTSLFGGKKSFTKLTFHVDDPDKFVECVNESIQLKI